MASQPISNVSVETSPLEAVGCERVAEGLECPLDPLDAPVASSRRCPRRVRPSLSLPEAHRGVGSNA
jgi:hypothetical protein